MSCKHGNWPPCDECDADDVLYIRIQNLENECADWTKGYGLLFKQNGQLRDLIELMFSSTMPYDKSGQPTFSDAVVNLWSNLNQVDSAGPSACYDEPQPAPVERTGCELGCTTECKAKTHGCASECPALPWQPKPAPAAVVGPTNKVLWLLMAQYGLNMTVGQDMDNLLNFGRDVWNAALSTIQPAPAAQDDAKDAARYRWLTDGHERPATRIVRNQLCERLPWMSYSAVSADIDAAIEASKREPT